MGSTEGTRRRARVLEDRQRRQGRLKSLDQSEFPPCFGCYSRESEACFDPKQDGADKVCGREFLCRPLTARRPSYDRDLLIDPSEMPRAIESARAIVANFTTAKRNSQGRELALSSFVRGFQTASSVDVIDLEKQPSIPKAVYTVPIRSTVTEAIRKVGVFAAVGSSSIDDVLICRLHLKKAGEVLDCEISTSVECLVDGYPSLQFERISIGFYPMPEDGFTIAAHNITSPYLLGVTVGSMLSRNQIFDLKVDNDGTVQKRLRL